MLTRLYEAKQLIGDARLKSMRVLMSRDATRGWNVSCRRQRGGEVAMTSVPGDSPRHPRCHARRDTESLPHNVNVKGIHAFGNSALMWISYKKGNRRKHFVVDVDVETRPEAVAQEPGGT